MADIQWHISQNGSQTGPINDAEFRQRAADGRLQRTDLVWREGMAQWEPAGTIGGVFPGNVPPPLPVAPVGYYAPPPGYQRDIGQDAGMRMLLPVGRSGWAIAAGYLGSSPRSMWKTLTLTLQRNLVVAQPSRLCLCAEDTGGTPAGRLCYEEMAL